MRSRQLLLSASAAAVLAACATAKQGYSNPSDGGGSDLGYFPPNLSSNGEPLNVIISGGSSSQVLTADGLMTFANALGYGKEVRRPTLAPASVSPSVPRGIRFFFPRSPDGSTD